MINLLKLYSKHSKNMTLVAIIFGSLSGILYSLLIPIIMTALDEFELENNIIDPTVFKVFEGMYIEVFSPRLGFIFLLICLLIVLFKTVSQIILTRIGVELASSIRKSLFSKISLSSISSLESVSSNSLIQTITTDVLKLVVGAKLIPEILTQVISVTGLLLFLLILDVNYFISVLISIFIGIIIFLVPSYFAQGLFQKARDDLDGIQDGFDALINGSYELKLNENKRHKYINETLFGFEESVVKKEKFAHTIVRSSLSIIDLLSFFVIGISIFILTNYYSIAFSDLTAVVMILIYITGPIGFILSALPHLAQATVSLKKVEDFSRTLLPEDINYSSRNIMPFHEINVHNAVFRHNTNDNASGFTAGPVNISFKRNQISFIVGGNGSGKTSLLKMLSLHYTASEGEILFDQQKLCSDNITSYRQHFSCIYSKYYLFSDLHNYFDNPDQTTNEVNRLLKAFDLSEIVSFNEGKFSTLDLSDGQKRRLALIVSFLDNKSVYIFDEWAADQDPKFKETFYREILPYLRDQNKIVIAITHDDRYFHLADQVIEMERGVVRNHYYN